jgi:hypothetical protein
MSPWWTNWGTLATLDMPSVVFYLLLKMMKLQGNFRANSLHTGGTGSIPVAPTMEIPRHGKSRHQMKSGIVADAGEAADR